MKEAMTLIKNWPTGKHDEDSLVKLKRGHTVCQTHLPKLGHMRDFKELPDGLEPTKNNLDTLMTEMANHTQSYNKLIETSRDALPEQTGAVCTGWNEWADARHVDLGIDSRTKGCDVPEDKVTQGDLLETERQTVLDAKQTSQYRSTVMRLAYLSVDRPDLCDSARGLAGAMKGPKLNDWLKLKKVVRYLVNYP
eukprot:s1276_g32.t1